MKKIIYTLVFVLSVQLTNDVSNCLAQWVQCDGLYGGTVYSYTVNGSNIFSGTGSNVFISSNSGVSWVPTTFNKTGYCLASSGSNIFAGTLSSGVYLSTNNLS